MVIAILHGSDVIRLYSFCVWFLDYNLHYGSHHQISKRLEELNQDYEKKNGKIRRSGELSENPILPSESNWSESICRQHLLDN